MAANLNFDIFIKKLLETDAVVSSRFNNAHMNIIRETLCNDFCQNYNFPNVLYIQSCHNGFDWETYIEEDGK